MQWNKWTILFLLAGLAGCVDPFVPETARYDSVFFIEALISNDTVNENIIRMSYSVPINSIANPVIGMPPERISGAHVSLIREDGKQIPFYEKSAGHYYAADQWIPLAGHAYRLFIEYQNNHFESPLQRMPEPNPIEDVGYRHEVSRMGEEGTIYDGYRFVVSTRNSRPHPTYFRWEVESAYQYSAAYEATHVWTGREQLPASNRDVMYCFSQKSTKGIYTASTEGLSQNVILDAPLHFESQYGDALSMRYSLLVKQFTINQEAWSFWSELSKQVAQSGGLYESQPYRISGNVSCSTNPDILVSGIFELGSCSEKRIFVNRPVEFDIIPVTCRLDTIGNQDLPWYRIPRGSYIIYDVASTKYFYANPPCFDCTLKGGTLQKPPFWEDAW